MELAGEEIGVPGDQSNDGCQQTWLGPRRVTQILWGISPKHKPMSPRGKQLELLLTMPVAEGQLPFDSDQGPGVNCWHRQVISTCRGGLVTARYQRKDSTQPWVVCLVGQDLVSN